MELKVNVRKFNENKSHVTHRRHRHPSQHIEINATFALLSKQRIATKKKVQKEMVSAKLGTAIDAIYCHKKWQPLPFICDCDVM